MACDKSKDFFRKKGISNRDSLSEADRISFSHIISQHVCDTMEWRTAENVLIYCSYMTEVSTKELIKEAFLSGKKVFCPKVIAPKNRIMEFYRVDSQQDLADGFHGIQEPITGEAFDPMIHRGDSVMIMPGTAFSRQRDRIGYNGGFYDTYLGKLTGTAGNTKTSSDIGLRGSLSKQDVFYTMAICYSCQILADELPCELHDVRPDYIVTEIEALNKNL